MGFVMTKVRLTNSWDLDRARRGEVPFAQVRSVEIEALVDTGAINMAIPEDIAEKLGASVRRARRVRIADGRSLEVFDVGPLDIELLGPGMTGEAIVLPRGTTPLLGALPLEYLDLVVVPSTGEVITNPAHPDGAIIPLLQAG
jgi:clan AA aspartic protease